MSVTDKVRGCGAATGADGWTPFYLPAAADEYSQVRFFLAHRVLPATVRGEVDELAVRLAEAAREHALSGAVAQLMAAYNLSSSEGRALMELAEALLRVPDAATRDTLIADKISGKDWLSDSPKGFAHVAALALSAAGMVAAGHNIRPAAATAGEDKNVGGGKIFADSVHRAVHKTTSLLAGSARRLGMPAIRACITEAMKILGGHFVFAQSIGAAVRRAGGNTHEKYSFDMLGEAARSEADAKKYYDAYLCAICAVGDRNGTKHPCEYDGVSIKLSALYPRYESSQWRAVGQKLLPRIVSLVRAAHRCNVQINIDAEEAARLELSLAIIRHIIALPELGEWEGLGAVVQSYDRRAGFVVRELIRCAAAQRRRLAVRLVKGAYWDGEIKTAQEKGLDDFPLFTRKAHSDIAFLHLAKILLDSPWVYPQIATHNAATVAAVAQLAQLAGRDDFEFQRLHGMGASLYEALAAKHRHRLRVYAPVGGHRDLLAYLVRRLLENGANASFMHQVTDSTVPVRDMVADPYDTAQRLINTPANLCTGANLYGVVRKNSRGWDLDNPATRRDLQNAVTPHLSVADEPPWSRPQEVDAAFNYLAAHAKLWAATAADDRARVLEKFADLLEAEAPRFFGLLMTEAGKTIADCVAEVREAVDFCRYYAVSARALPAAAEPRGTVLAISPWNFPLAIFCGQITAALAAGNVVLAKPAEQTPRIACAAVELLRRAGLPGHALQLIHGDGDTIGARAAAAGADMTVFTGSTQTARRIEKYLAESCRPGAPLLAETGGLNAMVVDSTALPERAVDDIVRSAYDSAGQRCSALRMLYVQEEVGAALLAMLRGAAELRNVGAAADFATDIGPVIDASAQQTINDYVERARLSGRLWWRGRVPAAGCYVAPAIIKVRGIDELPGEVFGPVLHAAFYRAGAEAEIINDINAAGYGLTFCVHSKIARVFDDCAARVNAGNVYVNRDQIGAVVGTQPFGGHGLSGTGPKAGGPMYIFAFTKNIAPPRHLAASEQILPGPDGERNVYRVGGRGHVLCVAPPPRAASLAAVARAAGNQVTVTDAWPDDAGAYDAVMIDALADAQIAALRRRLAAAPKIVPLIRSAGDYAWLFREKHICRDMTASGGNAELLARLDGSLCSE